MTTSWRLEAEAQVGRGVTARRYRLANGLGLLTAIDRSAPIVALQTWYRVGSRHERPGATGMAHLFEHLMFGQTERLAPGEFDRLVEGTGGESNAATWVDWTYYRLSLPARDLALGVRLESERMRLLVLEPGLVEAERDVVTNERRERVEDDVDGWLDEQLMAHAFTEHPYRWPTIGWMEDIRALSLPEIRAFYRTWYAPNNATIVCVGDFDEAQLMQLVADHYGAIPQAVLPAIAPPAEPEQTRERVVRAPKPIATDRLLIGYKAPGQDEVDWATLEIVATLLAGCPSARLYRRLIIEHEAASSVDAQLTPFRDPSLLRLAVTAARGHSADQILAAIDAELAQMVERPPDRAEVEKAKAIAETDFWTSLVDVDGKAEAIGHYEAALGDFRKVNTLAERLAAVTEADVARCVRSYLRPERRTVVIAQPESPDADDGDGDGDDAGAGEVATSAPGAPVA
ncbi:MAG TPA: pitrilysin family protein [Kofleriaceae bacterium]|jgi:zinc protease|nr:pitrilysin family protein [Kofleriaceae bacterium]